MNAGVPALYAPRNARIIHPIPYRGMKVRHGVINDVSSVLKTFIHLCSWTNVFIIDESVVRGCIGVTRDFYPFVEEHPDSPATPDSPSLHVDYPARVAVYDDAAAAPRVVVIEPKGVRDYLEEITATVSRLAREQGGVIPFMVIREVVENFIHSYFQQPTISILDGGNTIRFSDQGPGIQEKERALEYGTTSATEEMKQYIRGVGSGLPYVQQYMQDKGGSLTIEDNIASGTVVTICAQAPALPGGGGSHTPDYPPTQTLRQITTAGQRGNEAAVQRQGQPQAPSPSFTSLEISARGRTILDWLTTHESVGPTDLARAYTGSQPTWSRELQRLEEMGLVAKRAGQQKRFLTASGRAILNLP